MTPRQPLLRAGVALGGVAVLIWGAAAARGSRLQRRLRDALLLGLGGAGAVLWLDWLLLVAGHFHGPEFFHYYLGAKYSRELGYTRLYECATVADIEDGLVARVKRRKLRNQETYAIETTQALLANPARCKAHFSDPRWRLFRQDVRFLRERLHPARWERLLLDHGYNGTPAWALLGSALAGSAPISEARLWTLALVDPLLFVALCGVVAWAFGWRALCVPLIFLGSYAPASGRWTVGAFLRQDWLLAAVAGVCLLRRQWYGSAAVALAFAGMSRIFPFVLLGGVGARVLTGMVRQRSLRISPQISRLALAAGSTSVALLALSSSSGGGFDTWPRFFDKARLHLDSPLLNYMGLGTVLAYDPAWSASNTVDPSAEDPYQAWTRARLRTANARGPLLWTLTVAFGLLLLFAVRDQPDWAAAALGAGLVTVVGELTCYYYSILFATCLLAVRRVAAGVLLLGTAALSQAVESTWVAIDDIFTAQSVLIFLCVVAVTALFCGPVRSRS